MESVVDDVKVEALHAENSADYDDIDPAAEKRLVRKIDLYLMPSIFVLYLLSYVDRANIGLALVAGMQEDLSLNSTQYYVAVSLWVVGYTLGAVPSNMILSHTRPSIFIPCITFGWGAMAALIGVVKTQAQLNALRFFLGIFEAGFSPAVILIISTWYRKSEQSKRFIIFLSAGILSGAFGGVAAGAITSRLDGSHGIAGWRWLFIVEGVTTAGVSLLVHWTLLDYPHKSRALSAAETELAQKRLLQDGIDDTGDDPQSHTAKAIMASFVKAATSWRTWLLVPGYMTILGALAISYFYPTLVEGLGYTSTTAQYMTAPLYLVSLVIAVPVCIAADRNPHLRGRFLVVNLLSGAVFFALTAGIRNYTARYVLLCFINVTIWTGNALGLSFATTSLGSADRNVRAIMLALMNGIAALAQLYGSALFPDKDAPGYVTGFSVFAATFVFGAVLYGTADYLFRRYPLHARP